MYINSKKIITFLSIYIIFSSCSTNTKSSICSQLKTDIATFFNLNGKDKKSYFRTIENTSSEDFVNSVNKMGEDSEIKNRLKYHNCIKKSNSSSGEKRYTKIEKKIVNMISTTKTINHLQDFLASNNYMKHMKSIISYKIKLLLAHNESQKQISNSSSQDEKQLSDVNLEDNTEYFNIINRTIYQKYGLNIAIAFSKYYKHWNRDSFEMIKDISNENSGLIKYLIKREKKDYTPKEKLLFILENFGFNIKIINDMFDKEKIFKENEDICGICRQKFKQNDVLKITCIQEKPKINLHIYHKECITQWFKTKKTCPLCRKDLNICESINKNYLLSFNEKITILKDDDPEVHNPINNNAFLILNNPRPLAANFRLHPGEYTQNFIYSNVYSSLPPSNNSSEFRSVLGPSFNNMIHNY